MAQSLVEYAKEHPTHKGAPCWVCSQTQVVDVKENGKVRTGPVVDFINEGLRTGLYPTQIREWLINELNFNINECTLSKIQSHKQREHHEKKSA